MIKKQKETYIPYINFTAEYESNLSFLKAAFFPFALFVNVYEQKNTAVRIKETLAKSAKAELEPIEVNYSLDFYCFLKINPTFAIRN